MTSWIRSATSFARSHPSVPRSNVTTVSSAVPSAEAIGPTGRPRTPSNAARRVASAPALARSASVSPPGRSYTTTAGSASGDWNDCCTSIALVDSASPGSQEALSFFWTSVSLPASGPVTASTPSQNTTARNLVRRPLINLAAR